MKRAATQLMALAALALWLVVSQGHAQQLGLPQSAILTVSTDRMFAESAFGKRITREIDVQSAVLSTENRRIEAELTVEEQDLTRRRPEIDAPSFRALADAFDQKVQATRAAQDTKARALNKIADAARVEFFQVARPILESLMREARAGVILERANVFLSANATDITSLAIERIDAAIGDGSGLSSGPEQ